MSFQAKVATGDGVLARYGGSLVLAPSDSPVVDTVLDLAREADRDHASEPGRFLPRKVAGVISQTDDAPTLAVVSALEDGLAVLLVGDVSMTLTRDDGTSTVSGRDATTWVDQIVRGAWTSLVVTLGGAGAVDSRSDLQGGVVTAGGFALTPTTAATAAPMAPAPVAAAPVAAPPAAAAPMAAPVAVEAEPAMAPVMEAPTAFESFSLTEPVEAEPLPVAASAEAVAEARSTAPLTAVTEQPHSDGSMAGEDPAEGVMVQGIECSRQHFNDPTSIYCAVCGISMVHQTHNLVSGVRPPLGVAVFDDGAVFTLAGDYVLGREPDAAPEITSGTATPLVLDDPDVTMSRVHAKLLLVGWDVRLVDAGSANGTFTAKPGETEWTRVPSGETVVLKPGTKVSLGGRTFVFDSHHKL